MVLIALLTAFIAAEAVESLSRPRRRFGRTMYSLPLRLAIWLTLFGIFLAILGNVWNSAALVVFTAFGLTLGSGLKYRILGEPLVFSDFAIFVAAFRFPRLYLFAIPGAIRCVILFAVLLAIFCVVYGFVLDWHLHLLGMMLAAAGVFLLKLSIACPLMRQPDLLGDVKLHGIALTVFFYWQRWLAIRHDPTRAVNAETCANAQLLIVVQNESFCDPQHLIPGSETLPGLDAARQSAWAWGNLAADCFGAYTMRTEFGVLCGIDDSHLGFRRYDPFLTANGHADFALPAHLPEHHSIFLHPHDLRFFSRNEVMRHLGFDEILGACDTPAPIVEEGPYVSDRVLAEKIATYIDDPSPKLIFAVTMENHGPWADGDVSGKQGGWAGYLHHLRNGDVMLESLIEALIESKRNAVLAFFGDHRPSIPGMVEDGVERHTPYVILRFENGHFHSGPGRLDLTPAELHHKILAAAEAITERSPYGRSDPMQHEPATQG